MQINVYTLPELSMVGGSTLEFYLQMIDEYGEPVSLVGSTIDFAVCEFSSKTGVPLFRLTPTTELDGMGVTSVIKITVPASQTKNYFGKFVYQVTIIDGNGRVGIPNHGIINIFRNIDPAAIGTE